MPCRASADGKVIVCCGEPFEPKVSYCPFCDDQVQGVSREVFSGYGWDWVCGFCGTWISSGEYNPYISQSERRRNIEMVERVLAEPDES